MFSRRLSLLELLSICFFLLTLAERITGLENGPGVIEVVAKEGDDAILPCSLSTKQNIVPGLFDWKKDGQKEVFLYDAGIHYSNGRAGQDEQFKGRILHFEEELKHGNASIIIRNTNVADSGDYTCGFPHLQPNGQIFHIKLVVQLILRDRFGDIKDASPKPYILMLDQTEEMALLQCEVRGASPKPTVEWWDSAGNKLHAEEPQTPYGGDRHYVTLLTTVTTTGRVRCVATQEEIGHQTKAEMFVFISGKVDIVGWLLAGCVLGAVIVAAALLVLVATKCITIRCNKGSRLQRDGSSSSDTPDTKAGMLL